MLLKKGAMFGLEPRALKKQFGELFLVRVQSVTPKGAHGARIQTKSGAMFGLDARIALAIFGALSVISGAALYSAIESSKATSLVTELNEIGKAWESYYLDTGEVPGYLSTSSADAKYYRVNLNDLIDNPGVSGWSGPYLSYEKNTADATAGNLIHPQYGDIFIMTLNDKTDWGGSGFYSAGFCKTGEKCFVWAYISGMNDFASVIANADEIVDGVSDPTAGNLKAANNGAAVMLKIAPVKNRLG
jgi:hypothetical protein